MCRVPCPEPGFSRQLPHKDWPQLDREVLLPSYSRQICLNCRWFCHQVEPNCIPLLSCQFHHALILDGEYLSQHCCCWT
jgi:hypothetical protein